MSEETTIQSPAVEQPPIEQVVRTPFDEESWGVTPAKAEEITPTATEVVAPKEEPQDEILDPKDWLKRELDTDDIEALKTERAEYKKLKENPLSVKFENEQSERIYQLLKEGKSSEVKKFLETQEKLETYLSGEVDGNSADEIIKMGMAAKYKDLTDKEIAHKFNKQFAIPKEPVQAIDETDDEYEARKQDWQAQVDEVKMEKIIEAKLVRPDLEKLKSNLVLPDISKEQSSTERKPTQEELDAFDKAKGGFLQSAESVIGGFNGFNVPVKDKDVDYVVNYAPSQEEKTAISGMLKDFAESGFDANSLFVNRWVNEDGKSFKVEQMVKDLSLIYGNEKITEKLVTDSANKRLEAYFKEKKQVDVNGLNNGSLHLNKDNKTEMDKLRDFVFEN